MLDLRNKVMACSYRPITPGKYSPELIELVGKLLVLNPRNRWGRCLWLHAPRCTCSQVSFTYRRSESSKGDCVIGVTTKNVSSARRASTGLWRFAVDRRWTLITVFQQPRVQAKLAKLPHKCEPDLLKCKIACPCPVTHPPLSN